MSRTQTTIIHRATKQAVAAWLIDDLDEDAVNQVEEEWCGTRIAGAARLHQAGHPVPEHWHWDWRRKSSKLSLLAYRCMGIECENVMQGLMMTSTAKCSARLDPDAGKPLVYVEYLEAAPWNVKPIVEEPKYGGVGIRLFEAAIRYSQAEGFHGRVGLHSLPQADDFYASTCGMTSLGDDSQAYDLTYFEITRAQADQFLSEDES